jgi:hypothetical protein
LRIGVRGVIEEAMEGGAEVGQKRLQREIGCNICRFCDGQIHGAGQSLA